MSKIIDISILVFGKNENLQDLRNVWDNENGFVFVESEHTEQEFSLIKGASGLNFILINLNNLSHEIGFLNSVLNFFISKNISFYSMVLLDDDEGIYFYCHNNIMMKTNVIFSSISNFLTKINLRPLGIKSGFLKILTKDFDKKRILERIKNKSFMLSEENSKKFNLFLDSVEVSGDDW